MRGERVRETNGALDGVKEAGEVFKHISEQIRVDMFAEVKKPTLTREELGSFFAKLNEAYDSRTKV